MTLMIQWSKYDKFNDFDFGRSKTILNFRYDSGEESDDDEHCYTGKLRASKSIGELCDSLNNNSSFSPR